MTKYLIVLIAVFNFNGGQAQNDTPYAYINENELINARAIEAIQNYDTLTWYDTLNNFQKRAVQTFDENGNTLTRSFYYWSERPEPFGDEKTLVRKAGSEFWANWTLASEEKAVYDKNNNCLYYQKAGSSKVTDTERIYEYDKKGNKLLELVKYHSKNYSKTMFRYNKKGNIVSQKHMVWKSEQWQTTMNYICSFDNAGNKVNESWKDYSDGKLMITTKNQFTYNSENKLVEQINHYTTRDYQNVHKTTLTYNEADRIRNTSVYYKYNNAWNLLKTETYTYNAQKADTLPLLTEEEKRNSNISIYTNLIQLDAKGNELTRYTQRSEYDIYKTTCTYDSADNKLTELTERLNISNGRPVKKTYTYDEYGNMKSLLIEYKQDTIRYTYTRNALGGTLSGKYEELKNNTWQPFTAPDGPLDERLKFMFDKNVSMQMICHAFKATLRPISPVKKKVPY